MISSCWVRRCARACWRPPACGSNGRSRRWGDWRERDGGAVPGKGLNGSLVKRDAPLRMSQLDIQVMDMIVRSKLFKTNRSQAVRLPKALAFPDGVEEVEIRKVGNTRAYRPRRQTLGGLFRKWPVCDRRFLAERDRSSSGGAGALLVLRYMLDTDICVCVMTRRYPALRDSFDRLAAEISISSITLGELLVRRSRIQLVERPTRWL